MTSEVRSDLSRPGQPNLLSINPNLTQHSPKKHDFRPSAAKKEEFFGARPTDSTMATHLAPTIWALVLIVALLSALRVHLAADHRVSRLVGTTVWLSWVLSAVSMLILPIDLARQPPHVQGVERLSCDSQPFSALSVAWSLLLWSTLALGFAMVELLREYELTGAFTWRRGVRRALRRKARYYLAIALTGADRRWPAAAQGSCSKDLQQPWDRSPRRLPRLRPVRDRPAPFRGAGRVAARGVQRVERLLLDALPRLLPRPAASPPLAALHAASLRAAPAAATREAAARAARRGAGSCSEIGPRPLRDHLEIGVSSPRDRRRGPRRGVLSRAP